MTDACEKAKWNLIDAVADVIGVITSHESIKPVVAQIPEGAMDDLAEQIWEVIQPKVEACESDLIAEIETLRRHQAAILDALDGYKERLVRAEGEAHSLRERIAKEQTPKTVCPGPGMGNQL